MKILTFHGIKPTYCIKMTRDTSYSLDSFILDFFRSLLSVYFTNILHFYHHNEFTCVLYSIQLNINLHINFLVFHSMGQKYNNILNEAPYKSFFRYLLGG